MAGETRHKILDAAEKLILLKGLARVTTKEIARDWPVRKNIVTGLLHDRVL